MLALPAALLAAAVLSPADFALTEAVKTQTIEALLTELDEAYIFADKAAEAGRVIRAKVKAGEYGSISDPKLFANRLSDDVNAVLNDAHFHVSFSEQKLPKREDNRTPSPEEIKAYEEQVRQTNAGYERVERLAANIGYLEVRQFASAQFVKRPAAAAFSFLADTDALILDLRRNGGGDPGAVQILCSYLFGSERVLLNSIHYRRGNRTVESWTRDDVEGPRYDGRPIYVLVSQYTGSGAEECAYNLQTRKRAVIIGETTWGGANPGGIVHLNDHFSAFVPVGRAINPITQSNWEGTGVKPDIACPPQEALVRAQIMFLEEKAKTASPPDQAMIKARIAELNRQIAPSTSAVEAVPTRISLVN